MRPSESLYLRVSLPTWLPPRYVARTSFADCVVRAVQQIGVDHNKIGQLADLEGTDLVLAAASKKALLSVRVNHLLAIECLFGI